MFRKKNLVCMLIVATFLVSFIACTKADTGDSQTTTQSRYPTGNLDFVAPSGAGGGWDLTIRTVAKVLGDTKLVTVPMPVRNAAGAGGMVHLSALQAKKGDDRIITVYSPPLILLSLNGTTEFSFRDLTPLASLIADYGVFVVKSDSPHKNIMDVMNALKANPKSVKIGGASAAGSMDHVQFLIMAQAAGVQNLNQIDYISFDDDGATQVLGGHIDIFSTSLADVQGLIESGDLRGLAQTAGKRIGTGLKAEIPTCVESGIDKTFVNWRGLFGTANMPEVAVTFWREVLGKMVATPEWKAAEQNYGWDSAYLDAPEFTSFLEQVEGEYRAVLKDIGIIK